MGVVLSHNHNHNENRFCLLFCWGIVKNHKIMDLEVIDRRFKEWATVRHFPVMKKKGRS
jgi:hypothetical protein